MNQAALAAALTFMAADPSHDQVPGADGAYMPPAQTHDREYAESASLDSQQRYLQVQESERAELSPEPIYEDVPLWEEEPEVPAEAWIYDPTGSVPLRYQASEPGFDYSVDLMSGNVNVRMNPNN